jgi:hypothetical protein
MGLGNFLKDVGKTVAPIGNTLAGLTSPGSTIGNTMLPAITAAAPEVGVPLTLGSLIAQHYANQSASGANATGQQSNADQATQEEQPQ